jgi:DNA-binding PadR family transcriptional regulator
MHAIASSSNGRLKAGPGTLYVALRRLVQADLVREIANSNADARNKRTFAITRDGRAVMREELRHLSNIVDRAVSAGWLRTPRLGKAR